jgi:hypothetical protein
LDKPDSLTTEKAVVNSKEVTWNIVAGKVNQILRNTGSWLPPGPVIWSPPLNTAHKNFKIHNRKKNVK